MLYIVTYIMMIITVLALAKHLGEVDFFLFVSSPDDASSRPSQSHGSDSDRAAPVHGTVHFVLAL